MVEQYSLSRSGLEVYKTKEEEETPETTSSDSTNDSSDSDTSSNAEESSTDGFRLLNGEIEETYHYGNMYSNTFEEDYSDISSNGGATFHEIDQLQVYKGKKICLKKKWNAKTWDDLESLLLGFITEQTYSQDKVELKFSGMSKLMEQNAQFDFQQTKISEILTAIIEEAGLKAEVKPDGLNDRLVDYSNKSSSKSTSSGDANISSTGSKTIDEAVKKAIAGKTDALSKAKAIDQAFKSYIFYSYYYDCHYSTIEQAWNARRLNCADGANVLCAMFNAAGLDAVIMHVPSHYIVKLVIDGKTYYTDNAASTGAHTTRPFGQVWRGITSGSVVGKKIN